MESLWYLTKLELLSINGTDINRGWEYLPRKLVAIKCDEYNGRKIYKQLKNYPCLSEDITGYYNFPSWKLANKEKNCELIRQKIAKVRHQKFQAQIQILPKQN
jgi:hypothetical protein